MDFNRPKIGIPAVRRAPHPGERCLNAVEIGALFSKIHSPRDRAIFWVAFLRGLRASEIGLILLSDLNLSTRRLFVRRIQGGCSGDYPLTDGEFRALCRWLAIRGTWPGPLFPSRQGGAIARSRVHQLIKHYGNRAGLADAKLNLRCLRHSLVRLMNQRDRTDVKDRLGFSDVRSTARYLRAPLAETDQF